MSDPDLGWMYGAEAEKVPPLAETGKRADIRADQFQTARRP